MSGKKEKTILIVTLESHNHIVGDIERGVKIYERGGVEFEEREPNYYLATVPHKGNDTKLVSLTFSKSGQDLEHHFCSCTQRYTDPPVCRHVVAAVLAIQGGIVPSELSLGKSANATTVVNDTNTAKAVGSGSLDVFATPIMIALMERAACECLADVLEPEQSSVGTKVDVAHTAASPIGAEITATAAVEYVFGNRIEFTVTASDSSGEIGNGKHTRMIIDKEKFSSRAAQRGKTNES